MLINEINHVCYVRTGLSTGFTIASHEPYNNEINYSLRYWTLVHQLKLHFYKASINICINQKTAFIPLSIASIVNKDKKVLCYSNSVSAYQDIDLHKNFNRNLPLEIYNERESFIYKIKNFKNYDSFPHNIGIVFISINNENENLLNTINILFEILTSKARALVIDISPFSLQKNFKEITKLTSELGFKIYFFSDWPKKISQSNTQGNILLLCLPSGDNND